MTVSELYIYPIKSLGGISMAEVTVEPKGFRYDRRFMLVDANGVFMTQRNNHQMALVDTAIAGATLLVWHRHHPADVLQLPLELPVSSADEEPIPVDIWDSKSVPALPVSPEANHWFTNVIGRPCQLVFMPETTHRAVDPAYALANDAVSFADGYPYLLIGQASLDDLNQRLTEPVTMRRFRPSIVVSGSTPYDEDAWYHFQAGGMDFYGVKPCARCVLTTIDPETGEAGKEPLKTMATYRNWKTKILFGQNIVAKPTVQFPIGTLRVGQPVEVLSRQAPQLAAPEPVLTL